MDSTWPSVVVTFECFLEKVGMVRQRREEQAVFGNKILQYGHASMGVRVVLERGVWFVEVADIAGLPEEWYDSAILRDLLLGSGNDILPLLDQIAFVEVHWPAIVGQFDLTHRKDTHARLASLRKERARRRFPDFFPH